MLAFISETLSLRACVVPSFKVEVNLNFSPDGDGWNSHRQPTNRAAQIHLATYKHLHSVKVLITPMCLPPLSLFLISPPAVTISRLTSVCSPVIAGGECVCVCWGGGGQNSEEDNRKQRAGRRKRHLL